MSSFRSFFAFALTLSLLVIASPVLAQGKAPVFDPTSSSLTQEDPPPPDDGDKDFDEWDNDVLNLTSPASSPESSPASPATSSWAPELWLELLQEWLGVERR